jgi:thiol-disulfide isomerase/thioredoxin
MSVTGGVIALCAALAVATVFGVTLRRRAGRFRPGPAQASRAQASPARVDPAQADPADAGAAQPGPAATRPRDEALTEADLGSRLGERATLVQFSTAFCAPCRPARQILAQVAGMVDGVRHVEIDAAERLDLTRRLRINSAPTILVLDSEGGIVKRAVGLPRKADVIAALGAAITSTTPAGNNGIGSGRE